MFHLAETLGVVDPRALYQQVDSELMALWMAHFSLKHGNKPPVTPQVNSPIIDNPKNIDRQVSECERLLL